MISRPKDYAKENLVLVELDFPIIIKITKEQYAYNRTQAKEYGIRGYPTVTVLDANEGPAKKPLLSSGTMSKCSGTQSSNRRTLFTGAANNWPRLFYVALIASGPHS